MNTKTLISIGLYWLLKYFVYQYFIFVSIFYWLCYYSCLNFPPLSPLPCTPNPSSNHPLSFHVHGPIHISSLASPFPMLLLTFPCLFCTYQLCFLIPASFPLFSSFWLPAGNPPSDLHTYDSVPVIVVCLGFCLFCFYVQLLILVNLLPF